MFFSGNASYVGRGAGETDIVSVRRGGRDQTGFSIDGSYYVNFVEHREIGLVKYALFNSTKQVFNATDG